MKNFSWMACAFLLFSYRLSAYDLDKKREIHNYSWRIQSASEIKKSRVLSSAFLKDRFNEMKEIADSRAYMPLVDRPPHDFDFYWGASENLWVYAYHDEEENSNNVYFLGLLEVSTTKAARFRILYYPAELSESEQQYLMHAALNKLKNYQGGPIFLTTHAENAWWKDLLAEHFIAIAPEHFMSQENEELDATYSSFPPPNIYNCALIRLGDDKEYVIGGAPDFKVMASLCDPNKVLLDEVHAKLNVYHQTKDGFEKYMQNLAQAGIKKILLYYVGMSENGEGTQFPALKLNRAKETLNQPQLMDILNRAGFELIIIGYDSGNMGSIARRDQEEGHSPIYCSGMWKYSGKLSFCSCSRGEAAWASRIQGGYFTQAFAENLRLLEGDWLLAIEKTAPVIKEYSMTPVVETTNFCRDTL